MEGSVNSITRSQASERLLESAHYIFSHGIDDLALLVVVGSVLTGAHEELDFKAVANDVDHPLSGVFSADDKAGFSKWFNFLKHGVRGPRSLGEELDITFLGEGVGRDVYLFGLIWQAATFHVAAYETTSDLIEAVLLMGHTLFAYDESDEGFSASDQDFLEAHIRQLSRQWYSRHERAVENGVDLNKAKKDLRDSFVTPVADMLTSMPKRPLSNKVNRKRGK
ncbi:hypothetical protein PS718_00264 [Pseudomonas fluorescens]|uniref:Uncharacterized protein n=1 Tax=Pseudomonas fluorescens TaxID=294 RepID=A0A5E6ZS06_PSEFL|nr:hypothetical protein [Pseudomonas fluorescens]VVN68615.1 hypothetical protein PS718_00264 [Pseudomonas fluorescens]